MTFYKTKKEILLKGFFKDSIEKIDIKTYELLKNSVLYYKVNNSNDLADKIMFLLNSLDNIISYKNKIGKLKVNFISTWNDRVKEEIKILENLVNK